MDENKNPEPAYQEPDDPERAREDAIREHTTADWGTTTIELPIGVYEDLKALAAEEQLDPVQVLARLVTMAWRRRAQKREIAEEEHQQRTGKVLQELLSLATDLGVEDLAEQHDHYLYGTEKR
jgi:hypothetical protein